MGDKGDVLAQMLSQDTCIQFIMQPSDWSRPSSGTTNTCAPR
jgi:hypothetical protein